MYRITIVAEVEPTSAIEKSRYLNHMDEAHRSICMCISIELQFHLSAYSTPNEIWKKVEELYGKQDEMKGHLLEVELLSLDPQNYDKILPAILPMRFGKRLKISMGNRMR